MKKKLIEVALPLEAISAEAAREKSIRQAHPSTMHLWWSRKPLAACRAVLFASLVDDPASRPEDFPTEAAQDRERQRLFRLLEDLVKWDNSNNRSVLDAANEEIMKSTSGNPPPVYDPFCGGGSIPLEAQRLGLEAHGSDLNPVAVLITKALIEIPPKFAGQPPVNPAAKKKLSASGLWVGSRGLAEDVRYYGQWMRDRAFEQIGHLYPNVKLAGQNSTEATVIAWIWARTVLCPNPACGAQMPIASKFFLSTKPGGQAWVEPRIDVTAKTVRFEVKTGVPSEGEVAQIRLGTGVTNSKGKRAKALFRCIVCGSGRADGAYIDDQANRGLMGTTPLAVVCEGPRGRVYISFPESHSAALAAAEEWAARQGSSALALLPNEPARGTFASNAQGRQYGFRSFKDYFTPRQLAALSTFVGLVTEARGQVARDGGSTEYADAVATYLALGVSRLTDICNSLCRWEPSKTQVRNLFTRQAIPMIWEFAEPNVFAGAAGDLAVSIGNLAKALEAVPCHGRGQAHQLDAGAPYGPVHRLISTDPPYYSNIGYSDLSDFFYVWLRRALGVVYPNLFSTLLTPKHHELVATKYRFDGNAEQAEEFFEKGLAAAFAQMKASQHAAYPLTVFYAFKQSESDDDADDATGSEVASTGWETMLEGLLRAGLHITGTWPIRSELVSRPTASGANALASSIVLACRPRSDAAPITTRKDFLASLKRELPKALRDLQKGNIAPVDLAQAAIGPGMAVFSRYKKVLESDGSALRVRTALALINQTLDEVLSEQESDFDPDTRWALAWFEQNQFADGLYGQAEVLATAKAVAISGLMEAGLVHSRAGKVRLLRREELPEDWDPATDRRLTIWEVTQHLIRCLDKKGEPDTAALKARVGGLAETARELAYRLYTLCERKGWAEEAGYYNSLVVAWPSISRVPELFQ